MHLPVLVFVNCIDLDSFSGVLETVVQGDIKPLAGWWDTFSAPQLDQSEERRHESQDRYECN